MNLPIRTRVKNSLFYSLRFGFRLIPLKESTRDGLRQWFLDRFGNLTPTGPRGQASPTNKNRRAYARADGRAIGYVPHAKAELPDPLPATLVAFYLPQFHAIPENDEWWGKGFTEWRNVTRALPQFEGHAQPRLPGDLGFYDLRDPGVMRKQARLAREYGVGAFCFYFYWFGGKTLLEAPLRNWLADPSLDLPFCLCWANEKWSRRWDGRGDDILIDQQHSAEDDLAFIAHVAEYLRDPRYLRVDGQPMLLVYRPGLLPDAAATAQRWRNWCRENGIGEIHLVYVQGFERPDPDDIGFDAAVEFPPNLHNPSSVAARQHLINPDYAGDILDWRELARNAQSRPSSNYSRYAGVNPSWDNEARRPGKGRTYLHSSPRGYRDWLLHAIRSLPDNASASQRLVFINAWNEWAEGAVLEPDARLGYANLEATRQAQIASKRPLVNKASKPCVVIHAWYMDAFDEILGSLIDSGLDWRLVVTTTPEHADAVRARLDAFPMASEMDVTENRGRDILPFLRIANRLLDEGVEVVLKLHTKQSAHLNNGDGWRHELIERLIGGSRARNILDLFSKQSDLGLAAAEGHLLELDSYLGSNAENIGYLTLRMGVADQTTNDDFTSGSMFWVRLEALRPLLDAHLDESEFEPESGQIDGTLAHAIERVFTLSVNAAGYRVASAASLCGDPAPSAMPYAYARRN